MALSDIQLEIALQQFGIEPSEFDISNRAALQRLKDKVRRNFHAAARRLHPDVTNNDPEKAELFRIVCEFADEVAEMTIPKTKIRIHFRWSA